MSTHAGGSRTEPVDCIVWIDGEPFAIRVSPGVHTPSPFTQALVAALPRVDGLDVIDAGCGAGSVTVALLRRGAAHVSAWDIVPGGDRGHARERRAATPIRRASRPASARSTSSPTCRPTCSSRIRRSGRASVWEQLPADARGIGAGGEDGLEKLEIILASTSAPRVITSISTLTAPDLTPVAKRHGFARATVLADEPIAHDPIWRHAGSLDRRARARLGAAAHVSAPSPSAARARRTCPRSTTSSSSTRGDRILLAKERVQLYEDVQDFWVADQGGRVVGCGAVHPLWEDIAEIRTVAVDPSVRGQGVGKLIVERLIATVRELGIARVFVLTFEREFFAAFGFREIEGTPVTAEVYAELRSSFDEGVAEFLDLERVKPNTLGNHRMLLELNH